MKNFEKTIIELKPSNIKGIGFFAAKNIARGETIAEGIHGSDYDNLVPWSSVSQMDQDTKSRINAYCLGTPEGFFPPPENDSGEYSFNKLSAEWYMNHSCKGNVGFNEEGDFIAIRDIQKGEELTYDYGLAESNPDFKMTCKCGSQHCRKVITGNDWKDQHFRERNLNYMLPFLRK